MTKWLTAWAVGMTLLASYPSAAQETPQNQAETSDTKSEKDKDDMVTIRLIDEIQPKEKERNFQQAVSANLSDVVKIDGQLKRVVDLARIQVEGVAKGERDQSGYKSVLNWRALAMKDDQGETKRKFLSAPLQSEARFKEEVKPGDEYPAKGDVTSLLNDVKALLAEAIGKAEEEAEEAKKQAETAIQSLAGGASNPGGENQSSGFTLYKDDKNPEITPNTVYGTTTDGCEVRLSEDLTTVYEQSKTTENGTAVGNCADSGRSFTVNFSEDSCPLDYEPGAEYANILFKAFYVKDAETRYLQKDGKDCFRHMDKKYTVDYNETACPDNPAVSPDSDTGKVTVRGEPFATRASGEYVRLAQCADVQEVDIDWIIDDCGLSDDWTAEKTFQKQKAVYTFKGRQYTALSCVIRNSVSYDMEKVDTNCPVTKVGSGPDAAIIKAYDYVIYIDGEQKLRQSCRSDTKSVPVIYNTEACVGTFIHDEDVSYGTVKVQFKDPDTEQLRDLGQCERDLEVKYEHKIQTVDWRPVDAELIAYAMRETYIDTNVGHRTVKTEEAELGSPYTFVENKTMASDTYFHEGCRRWEETGNYDIYDRPDESKYSRLVKAGEPLDQGDVCKSRIKWSDEYTFSSRTVQKYRGSELEDWCNSAIQSTATREIYRTTDNFIVSKDQKVGKFAFEWSTNTYTSKCSTWKPVMFPAHNGEAKSTYPNDWTSFYPVLSTGGSSGKAEWLQVWNWQ